MNDMNDMDNMNSMNSIKNIKSMVELMETPQNHPYTQLISKSTKPGILIIL